MGATIWLVLLLGLCYLGARHKDYGVEARHSEPHLDNAISHSPSIDLEHKLLLECQNSDYRMYIKCLKREKRHHEDSDHRKSCLDECLERNCTNHACTRDCYTHCRKRVIEVSSKTVETTYDCANGECGSKGPNITANIHIQNILPNITCSACPDKCHNNTCIESGPVINNVINNNILQPSSSICPCPGCYCYQWQPQITIGIGLGGPMGGGCIYPSWPCLQRDPNFADCSMCNNPFLRFQCSPICVPIASPNTTTAAFKHGGSFAGGKFNGG